MTTKILFTALILTVQSTVFAQWTQVQSGTMSNLKDVHFPTNTIGYAVGDNRTVLKSVDSGNSWQTVFTDSLLSFTSVFFTSVDTGYATAGNLYKTTNAGVSWTEIITDTFGQMGEVYFVNSNLGFASGSLLHKTTDAGITWTSINLNNTFSSIHFPNDSVGYFIGGPGAADQLYKTIDGGQNFVAITNGFQSIKEATHFLSSDIGYICGWYSDVLAKTIDGGVSWQQVDTIGITQCWDVHFVNENIGYYIDNSGGNYKISNTIDGGATWTSQLVANGVYLNAFYFVSSNLAIAVGNYGTIYKTNNGGSVGILEEKQIENVTIYPNPFSNLATIKLSQNLKNGTLKIFNFMGQQVTELKELNGQSIDLHRDYLQSGMYLVHIIQDGKVVSIGKIIIND
jgi:photosystem II stability/assembly factor-like uncharacterized protein